MGTETTNQKQAGEDKLICLQNEMESLQNECSTYKQNNYNLKLNEQALVEKYTQNFNEFNAEYVILQNKMQISENANQCLTAKLEEFEQTMSQRKEEPHTVSIKYNTLKIEYEKICNKLKSNQKKYKNIVHEQKKSKTKMKELMQKLEKQSEIHQAAMESELESETICKLKQEIDVLQQQLFEGSNIRRELREFIAKYQRDGQMKLNKNFQKLVKMKKLVLATMNVLHDERKFIEHNDSLRAHFELLKQRMGENQENYPNK